MRWSLRCGLLAAMVIGIQGAASGQSLLSAGGLGLPADGVDAWARGMGSLGTGLILPALLPAEPTGSLDLVLAPTVTFTMEPAWGTFSEGGAEGELRGNRFGMIGGVYPLNLRSTVSLSISSVFDQRWQVQRESTSDLGGRAVPTTDAFESDGGVAAVRVGYARRISPALGVAATVGIYTGSVTRTLERTFEGADGATPITPFTSSGKWRYSGPLASVGVAWDPLAGVRISGSLHWSGTLNANATDDFDVADAGFDVPLELKVGGSALVRDGLVLSLGFSTADWGGIADDLATPTPVGRVLSYGVGLEYRLGRFLGGPFPLRAGFRHRDLPFGFGGSEASENSLATGVTLTLLEAASTPLATVDFAFEFGSRDSGLLSEDFRRLSMTVRVSGG